MTGRMAKRSLGSWNVFVRDNCGVVVGCNKNVFISRLTKLMRSKGRKWFGWLLRLTEYILFKRVNLLWCVAVNLVCQGSIFFLVAWEVRRASQSTFGWYRAKLIFAAVTELLRHLWTHINRGRPGRFWSSIKFLVKTGAGKAFVVDQQDFVLLHRSLIKSMRIFFRGVDGASFWRNEVRVESAFGNVGDCVPHCLVRNP